MAVDLRFRVAQTFLSVPAQTRMSVQPEISVLTKHCGAWAPRAGEPSLNNADTGAVVFDGRRSPGEARKRCRIERHHSHPGTQLNNHANRVSPNQYAGRSYVG